MANILSSFVPTVWSQTLIMKKNARLVGHNFINRNWQGEIEQKGDTVRIITPDSVEVNDYTGADITHQDVSATHQDLVINKAKYFDMVFSDIENFQSISALMEIYTGMAGVKLQEAQDKEVFKLAAADAGSDNILTSETFTKDEVYDIAIDAREKLSLQNVPLDGRNIAISPSEESIFLRSPHFIPATASGDNVIRTGLIGRIAGFNIFTSNLLWQDDPATLSVGDPIYRYLPFSTPEAITWADQIVSVETFRTEKNFFDGVKGLHVYGAKTVQPDSLGVIKRRIGTKA